MKNLIEDREMNGRGYRYMISLHYDRWINCWRIARKD